MIIRINSVTKNIIKSIIFHKFEKIFLKNDTFIFCILINKKLGERVILDKDKFFVFERISNTTYANMIRRREKCKFIRQSEKIIVE